MAAIAAAALPPSPDVPEDDRDQRVVLHDLEWDQYEALLAIRGEASVPRMAYLEGELELMSPSRGHEVKKTFIARLLEAYAEERGLFFNGYGSLTMRSAPKRRGIEPDECYTIGSDKENPDLAIEVIWTPGGIDKRRIYAGLGVRELWEWKRGRIQVMTLEGSDYREVSQSSVLPGLDLAQLVSFAERADQTEAVRAYRRALRGE